MPIPPLVDGFLPEGLYDATLDDVAAVFGQFQLTDQRVKLMNRLRDYLAEAEISGVVQALVVDGSFVSDKPNPSDIDLIAVLKPEHDFEAELLPVDYAILSGKRARRKFGFDVFQASEGSHALGEFVAFLSQVKDMPDRRKGLLRIGL